MRECARTDANAYPGSQPDARAVTNAGGDELLAGVSYGLYPAAATGLGLQGHPLPSVHGAAAGPAPVRQ